MKLCANKQLFLVFCSINVNKALVFDHQTPVFDEVMRYQDRVANEALSFARSTTLYIGSRKTLVIFQIFKVFFNFAKASIKVIDIISHFLFHYFFLLFTSFHKQKCINGGSFDREWNDVFTWNIYGVDLAAHITGYIPS